MEWKFFYKKHFSFKDWEALAVQIFNFQRFFVEDSPAQASQSPFETFPILKLTKGTNLFSINHF